MKSTLQYKTNKPFIKSAHIDGEKIIIKFPYNPEYITEVKSLPDRKYNPDKKHWSTPIKIDTIKKLKEWGYQFDEGLWKRIKELAPADYQPITPAGLRGRLYPFQKLGIGFIESRNGKALIGDEMGLGKTIQALGYLQLHPEKRPVIIVCPASLKLNWLREINRWMSGIAKKAVILNGKKPYNVSADIFIINYDIISGWKKWIDQKAPEVLIIDEIHFLKNSAAKRTRAIKHIARRISCVIGLSGTPIINRPVEIYNAVQLINTAILPPFPQFAERYCDRKHNGFGFDDSGASNTDELYERLRSTIMIRRKKVDVLKDLPSKIISVVPFEIDNRSEYDHAVDDFLRYLKVTVGEEKATRAARAESLVKIEALKQLAVQGKMKFVLDWIDQFLDTDEKLVVFTSHVKTINTIYNEFRDEAVKVDGSVSKTDRDWAVNEFQNNPLVRLFAGNYKAAGVGLTLTAASNVAAIELPWTPGELLQAEDRLHRIGQKKCVNVWYLLGEDTIEVDIARILDRKREVLSKVLDGEQIDSESLLSTLISNLKK